MIDVFVGIRRGERSVVQLAVDGPVRVGEYGVLCGEVPELGSALRVVIHEGRCEPFESRSAVEVSEVDGGLSVAKDELERAVGAAAAVPSR